MQIHLDKLHSKPLSWSAISSFEYSVEQWSRKYLDGKYEEPNELMKFGNIVGGRIATDPEYLPAVERYSVFEKKLTAKIERKGLSKIELVGLFDSFDPETKFFYEYKTSSNTSRWTLETAKEHGQILFYLFLIWKNYGVPPEKIKIKLFYIPVITKGDFTMEVVESGIQQFPIEHTCLGILKFADYIKHTYAKMEAFALAYNPA